MLIAMRKTISMLLLAVVSASAMAEWVEVGRGKSDTLYVDVSAIRGTDDKAKMWALNDYRAPQRPGKRRPFMSEKAQFEYDCKEQQSRLLYFTSHSGNMAGGEIVDYNIVPGEWTRIAPGSGLEALWKIACGKV